MRAGLSILREAGLAAVIGGAFASPAQASSQADLELFAMERVTWDDNVFRLSGDRDAIAILGSASTADTRYQTAAGINLNVASARQRLSGTISLFDARYDRFTALDLTGHEGRAHWFWQPGRAWQGDVEYTEERDLASLANLQSGIQSSTPDILTSRRTSIGFGYQPVGGWQLRVEVGRREQSNSAPESRLNDMKLDEAGVSVNYLTRSANRIGVEFRSATGNLANRQLIAGMSIDNGYDQGDLVASIDWAITGLSRLRAGVGHVARSYSQLPARDYDGLTWRIGYEWQPGPRLTINVLACRDISAVEQINVGFVLARSVMAMSTLRVTQRLDLAASFEVNHRDYLGDAGFALGTVASRAEIVSAAALTISYRPARAVTLSLGVRHEARSTAAVEFGDYAANVVNLGVRILH